MCDQRTGFLECYISQKSPFNYGLLISVKCENWFGKSLIQRPQPIFAKKSERPAKNE